MLLSEEEVVGVTRSMISGMEVVVVVDGVGDTRSMISGVVVVVVVDGVLLRVVVVAAVVLTRSMISPSSALK